MWTIIGQSRALSLLKRSLEKGSLAHAYLFVGPAHVGKMTLALNLAQALNCKAAEPPCGQCLSCQKIASNKHADVQIIGLNHNDSSEASSRVEIGIDQIRQLQHSAHLPPFEGSCKVFIIDRAELLSTEAANCFLKTLEEPADKVVFILLTSNERLLPVTVVSRCQRVGLLPIAISEIEAALEKKGVTSEKAKLVARLSHGCPGWALDAHWFQQRTEHLEELLSLINADGEERFAYAARLAAQFSRDRELVHNKLDLWLDCWRDLMLVKAGSSGSVTNIDQLAALIDLARGYRLAQITAFLNCIRVADDQLRQNANPQLVLEVLMLNIPELEKRSKENSAIQFEVNYG
ncbi:MAG: AAA family ATPase [Chloroflexi bacterium]|nr:AAA family ATPase [Chloroflexota bacterium]